MISLEDEFGDVIRKARSGLGLEVASVAAACGLTERDVKSMEVYTRRPSDHEVDRLASTLGLRASALRALANETIIAPDGPWQVGDLTVHRETTHYPSHCYLIGFSGGAQLSIRVTAMSWTQSHVRRGRPASILSQSS